MRSRIPDIKGVSSMMNNLKIRSSLYLTGAIAILLMVFIGSYGLFKLSSSQKKLETSISKSDELIEAVDIARTVQVEFKKQVQEWKDILLRGHEKESFDKYNEQFKTSGELVQKDLAALKKIAEDIKFDTSKINNLLTEHSSLMLEYLSALKNFDPNDAMSYRKVDHLVRGIDRQPTTDMDNLVSDIKGYSDQLFYNMISTSKNEYNSIFRFYVLVIIITLIILSVILWSISARIINSLTNTINSLTSSSAQIASTIDEHERIASLQSASVNQTTATTTQLGASSRLSLEQAEAAQQDSRKALNEVEKGGSIVSEMLEGMEGLKARVTVISEQILGLSNLINQISGIAKLVTNFANETKMLAMNAAIEAVRAGKSGKGFSLLSVEIRKLAQESKTSSENITQLVSSIIKSSETTVTSAQEGLTTVTQEMELAHQTSQAFKNISNSINNTFESTKQIGLNVNQQSIGTFQIVEAMNSLNIGAKETASGISQTKTSIKILNDLSKELKDMI